VGRDTKNAFHLAIPCRNLDEAQEFYVGKLGVRLARRYHDRITLDFFGDQVVCHLAPDKIEQKPELYPRHFGITFRDRSDFERLLSSVQTKGVEFFQDLSVRFPGLREEHLTFFLKDPSNNVLEFKYYHDPEMMH
jgi:hypothetical protein